MCIFSAVVGAVADTRIFARFSNSDRQFLVYSMSYAAESELAMILPLPVPPVETDEDAVRFIDLSDYAKFFSDMKKGFPEYRPRGDLRSRAPVAASAPKLRVHSVGSFDASFVPTLSDFVRLDSRFRLPADVWAHLPTYSDYGFAVFKLKPGARRVHPMAFEFPTRDAEQLFFPTVHVHDGKVDDQAWFDHSLYCQVEGGLETWRTSSSDPEGQLPIPASEFMNIPKTLGLVNPVTPIYWQRMLGVRENRDILLGPKHTK